MLRLAVRAVFENQLVLALKVGDTLTATVTGGEGTVTYQWLANDIVIPGATDATLKVKEDFIGQVLSVIVTDEEGNTAESDDTAPVTTDMSAEIKLVDRNGLQPDGTALDTDTLDVSYGADLGTPNIIVWYCNGAAKAVYSLSGGNITAASFMSAPVVDPIKGVLDAGDWWVTIENTAGDVSVTNVVTVASNNVAVMTDFAIEDDYDTPRVTLADKTTTAIIDVTFNKQYFGTLYLNEVDNETYTTAKMVGAIDLTSAATTTTTWGADLADVKKASNLTNDAVSGLATGKGKYYAESDGTVHAKIKVPAQVTRGTNYELIFEQEDVKGDELGAKAKKEDLNVSNSYEAPYVVAPAEIAVTSYAKGTTTPQVTMYDENGEVLDWWTATAVTATNAVEPGFDSMAFYSIDSNTASASDTATPTSKVEIKEGVATLTIGAAANDYGYAKFKTTKGIFGAASATLTSEVFEGAMDPMTNMTLKQDSDDPKAAKIEFKNLKGVASGNVYIYQAKDATDLAAGVATVAGYDTKKAIGSAEVAGGTTKVIIDDVFEAVDTTNAYKNAFVAVFVPDDTDLFKTVYNGSDNSSTIAAPDFFTLAQNLTKYALVGDEEAATAVASGYQFSATGAYDSAGDGSGTPAYLEALDQFGDVIALAGGGPAAVLQASAAFEAVKSSFNGDPTYDPATTATNEINISTVANNGHKATAIVLGDTALGGQKTLAKGNKIAATLRTGQTLTLECTAAAADGKIKFKLSIS